MAWIESHQEILQHPKTRKLAYSLDIGVPTAIGHLHCLWWWAMSYAKDGDLAQFDDVDIAIGAQWMGDPETFVKALVTVGFLDLHTVDEDCKSIHDWNQYGGKLLAKREADADRKRRTRDVTSTSTGHPPDIHRTAQVEKKTKEKNTRQTTPQPPNANGATAPPASDYRTLIGDDYWSALDAFKKVDPSLSNGWLDKALKRAPPGLSPDRLFQALENALNRVGEDFQRNATQPFIKSKYGWANTIVDEELADAQRMTT